MKLRERIENKLYNLLAGRTGRVADRICIAVCLLAAAYFLGHVLISLIR